MEKLSQLNATIQMAIKSDGFNLVDVSEMIGAKRHKANYITFINKS